MPHIKALVEFEQVKKIILITLEEKTNLEDGTSIITDLPKVKWFPFTASNYKVRLLNQIGDYRNGCKKLQHVIAAENADAVIAHGAPAGTIVHKATKRSDVPYFVSLFEPHADYMLESGVWNKCGLRYMMQKRWEEHQKNAAGLMPVAEGYKQKLLTEGVPGNKVIAVPCSVDADHFRFDAAGRTKMRRKLRWEKATIGIYVGKFGGLYYNEEAFQIYQQCFRLIPDFRLIILSPQPKEEIKQQLSIYKMDLGNVYVASVPHEQVPIFLSASDFALATYKAGPSKKYLSPVKIGEYWANGLPVLLTEGVGDDSDIIKNEGGGALFNLQQTGSLEKAIEQIQTIVRNPKHRYEIPKLALEYRSPEKIREAYEYFFAQLANSEL
ncbi:glycosyltransferase [Pontibacter populi]|uniref:Glycosyltransferase subfamily 4-like N-terminal domain-containing protein n=1 Tax=Pontibacter populi TaxID=890055 RepID=A0ABV1RPZ7_9BACT